MSSQAIPLTYKGHPLRRKDSLIYYGSMAEKYIIMLQILDQKKDKDMDVATKVSVQLQPGPRGEKDRERQPVRRHGCGLRLAGPGALQ